jgi:glycosyltransferase involved in cell wall biosynthesis
VKKNIKNIESSMVSVCMLAYNLDKYVAQAIESVLMQKTNFRIKLVIGEDNSTDNTRQICLKYKKLYPNLIKLNLNNHNIGMQRNFINTIKSCEGKYLAILDADDYWTDEYKLQKQIDFLEANPDYIVCFHNSEIVDDNTGKIIGKCFNKQIKDTYTHKDILYNSIQPTLTTVFRNHLVTEFPEWFYHTFATDMSFFILLSKYGKSKYIDEVMSTYRVHLGGTYSSKSRISTLSLSILPLIKLRDHIEPEYMHILNSTIYYRRFLLIKQYIKRKRFIEGRKEAIKCLTHFHYFDRRVSLIEFFLLMIVSIIPILYKPATLFYKGLKNMSKEIKKDSLLSLL